ncbi:hypothetical protein EDB85DRAFT_2275612 [Lactarius pseudohatsudake]|nr:hypothetical protein EDB85DRAFT_2275612 [Lactarius pseudohatsudake]
MLCRSIRGVTQVEEAENGESGKLLCVPDVGGVWLELARNVYCHSHDGSRTRRFDAQDRDPGRRRDGDTQLNGGPAECPASDVTRVALEVGTQGILGGQARVESVQGTWADSILNVNKMASNLTDQVRSISEVTKAIALGDFSKQVEVDVQGEMLDLKMTVNSMVNQLSTLANEVTRVSLEVGTHLIVVDIVF